MRVLLPCAKEAAAKRRRLLLLQLLGAQTETETLGSEDHINALSLPENTSDEYTESDRVASIASLSTEFLVKPSSNEAQYPSSDISAAAFSKPSPSSFPVGDKKEPPLAAEAVPSTLTVPLLQSALCKPCAADQDISSSSVTFAKRPPGDSQHSLLAATTSTTTAASQRKNPPPHSSKKRPRSPDSKPPAKPMTAGGRIVRPRTDSDDVIHTGSLASNTSTSSSASNSQFVQQQQQPVDDGSASSEPLENEPPVFENIRTTITIRPKVQDAPPASSPSDEKKKSSVEPTPTDLAFQKALKARGLEIAEQEGDGNCLFRAVSLQVYGDPSMHGEVRERCLDFMERDPEHFAPFVATKGEKDDSSSSSKDAFAAYIARKRILGVHGNNPEIQAISELFNRPVEVFTPDQGATPLNIFQSAYKTQDAPIRLSYHDGNHYNAVIDPLVPTAGLGLGLPGLQPGLADKLQVAKAVAESDYMADELEFEKALKASEEDEVRRAIKESSASMDKMYQSKMLAFSDLDATNFDLEQKALANSLETFRRQEHGRKQRASPNAGRQREEESAPVRDFPVFSSDPTASVAAAAAAAPEESSVASLPVASVPSVASAASAASASDDDPPLPSVLGSADEYPQTVQELVMNGFELRKVVHAYELIGDNFDDLLAFLITNNSA